MGKNFMKALFILSVSLQINCGFANDGMTIEGETCPRPECRFEMDKFLTKCQKDHSEIAPQINGATEAERSWQWLTALSHDHENTVEWAMANIGRAKLFLTQDAPPAGAYGPWVADPRKEYHVFLINRLRLEGGVLPWLEGQEEQEKERKWCKIQLGYLYRDYALRYHPHDVSRARYLGESYNMFLQVLSANTTKTVLYCLASLILHENYTPQGMTRDQAIEQANDYLAQATRRAPSTGTPWTNGNQTSALGIAARPLYTRGLTESMDAIVISDTDEETDDMDVDGASEVDSTDDMDEEVSEAEAETVVPIAEQIQVVKNRIPGLMLVLTDAHIQYVLEHQTNNIESLVGDLWREFTVEQRRLLGRSRDARHMQLTQYVTQILEVAA